MLTYLCLNWAENMHTMFVFFSWSITKSDDKNISLSALKMSTSVSNAAVVKYVLRRTREEEVLRGSRRVKVRKRRRERVWRWMRKDGYRRFCLVTESALVSHPRSLSLPVLTVFNEA